MLLSGPRVGLHLLQVGRCFHPERITLRGGKWRIIDFPALVAVILHPTEGPILYDTGYAERFDTATDPFPERLYRWLTPARLPAEERLGTQLGRLGIGLDDVRRVLVSHFHADHVAGLRDLPRAGILALEADVVASLAAPWASLTGLAAPRAPAGRGRGDAGDERDAARLAEGGPRGDGVPAGRWARLRLLRRGYLPALLPDDFAARLSLVDERPVVDLGSEWAPFERGFDLLGDRSLIGIPLPGHSPAQLGVLLRTEDDRPVLLAADACWSARAYRELRMPSLLARPLFADWGAYRATLTGLHGLALRQPELEIVPSHCAATLAAFRPVVHPRGQRLVEALPGQS